MQGQKKLHFVRWRTLNLSDYTSTGAALVSHLANAGSYPLGLPRLRALIDTECFRQSFPSGRTRLQGRIDLVTATLSDLRLKAGVHSVIDIKKHASRWGLRPCPAFVLPYLFLTDLQHDTSLDSGIAAMKPIEDAQKVPWVFRFERWAGRVRLNVRNAQANIAVGASQTFVFSGPIQ